MTPTDVVARAPELTALDAALERAQREPSALVLEGGVDGPIAVDGVRGTVDGLDWRRGDPQR
jgi:hypothetical protein